MSNTLENIYGIVVLVNIDFRSNIRLTDFSLFCFVIINLISFTAPDDKLFQNDHEEYIRRDICGVDIGTRRGAACNLAGMLLRKCEAESSAILGRILKTYLLKYDHSNENWRAKSSVLYLITSLASLHETEDNSHERNI